MIELEKAAREYVTEECGRVYPGDNQHDDSHWMFGANELYIAYLEGARQLLEQARKDQFAVINDESPVVLISTLERLMGERE